MIENGRIPCINPCCRRTGAADKYGDDEGEIVCGKCWRALPLALRQRHRALSRRSRRLLKLIEKRIAIGTMDRATFDRVRDSMGRHFEVNWSRIRNYFLKPEKPVGLEGFLQEIGL